jgi:hypothetical protein
MSSVGSNKDINQTIIIEPLVVSNSTLTACTAIYTAQLITCDGTNSLTLSGGLSTFSKGVNVLSGLTASTGYFTNNIFSGGTNLLNIFSTEDNYTTGTTLIGSTVYFDRTNTPSAYTLSLSAFSTHDYYVTGATYNDNIFTFTNNTGGTFSLSLNTMTGLTVNGTLLSNVISATTYQNLPTDIRITGGTYTAGTATFTNNTGGTFTVNGFYTGATDVFVTGGTYSSGTATFTNNTGGTFTVNGFKTSDIFVTGATYSNNTFTFTNNSGGTFNTNFDTVTGLTVNGNTLITGNTNISGNTSIEGDIISGGTNLLNIFALAGSDTNTYVTGGTFNNDTITLTRNDNVNINISGITDYYTTGATFNNNILYFDRNDSLSAYTVNLSSLDVYTTGVTFNNNILTTTNNSGGTINTLINNLTGLTVTGSLSANTLYGNGSNITGINFNQLATTAHTHHISDIINLQSSLNNKFDKSGGTISGDVFINGNVSILGTATTINTTTLSVEDNIITLNSNVTGATQTPLLNAGFEVMRGSATTKTFQWDESNKRWSLDDNTIINGNLITTGTTNISGTTYIGGDIISGGTNLLTLFKPLNATDVYITGGTYSNGTSTFTNNTGGTFNVTGYYTGATDIYTTGATLNGNTLSFNRNDVLSAYTVNLTPIISNLWTGGTGAGSVALSGSNSTASGQLSVAEGLQTTASGTQSHAEGTLSKATDESAHAEGYSTSAGYISHAEGYFTTATLLSHAEGHSTTAYDYGAHAEGRGTMATGQGTHAEGQYTIASVASAHAEGDSTIAGNAGAHAEGGYTTASGGYSHAEGYLSIASGNYSHSEGYYTTASGYVSHVGGQYNIASGNTAFIHSSGSTVMGDYSSILGGKGHRVNPGVTGSTILGGSYITGTTNDTVYGVNFNASGSIFSGGTNLTSIFALAGSDTNTYVTGGTFNNNLLTLTRNDNVQVNTLINNFSALTVNGDIISNNTTRISQNNITGATTVDTINTGATDGAVWHYTVKTSSDLRAGTVTAGWIGSSVVYNESSTTDIGNTDAITISVIESGGNILFVVTPSSGNWTVKLNRLLI